MRCWKNRKRGTPALLKRSGRTRTPGRLHGSCGTSAIRPSGGWRENMAFCSNGAQERRIRTSLSKSLKKSPKVSVVAKKLGVSQPVVARIGKSAGIALAKKGGQRKLTPGQEAEVLRALRLNPNASAVARQIGGISYKSVSRYAKRANIKV